MKVLVSDPLSDVGVKILQETPGIDVDVNTGLAPEELKTIIGQYDGLVIRSATKVTADLLNAAPRLKVVGNTSWSTGRASSLCAGLSAVPSQAPGALVFPADMPLMSTHLINAVVSAFLQTGALCFPVYNRRKGHPVAFPRSWFVRLRQLNGETSGYELILGGWGGAVKLERTDEQTQWNLNTPESYGKLLQRGFEASL